MDSRFSWVRRSLGGAVLVGVALLSACGPTPPPAPTRVTPPPPVIVIPPKPVPPEGAPADLKTPPIAADGQRHTVNYGISTPQAVWNLRSAYNVAALNCPEAKYAPITEGYKRFLTVYAKQLAAASKEIDRSFAYGHSRIEAIRARETYQTQVYNYFSLPPVDSAFCETAMEVTSDLQAITPDQFDAWSYVGLAKMEKPFKDFFDAFEKYRADLAAWEAQYGGGLLTVRPDFEQQAERARQQFGDTAAPAPASAPTDAPVGDPSQR
ncbi:hypothetical protein MTR62_14640 [Novosphingobium sp. 1949]|uniref:Lipoprotein n=1 Tax=Novosphingobium organovorum TaxID=2930092 RepID=A0ABT0BG06_9SPHN|nr:hypothetical protein [Novosphingobium organovorum]MCJ2183923.1 hypothetical protein [Novosphingobium organovorum]